MGRGKGREKGRLLKVDRRRHGRERQEDTGKGKEEEKKEEGREM